MDGVTTISAQHDCYEQALKAAARAYLAALDRRDRSAPAASSTGGRPLRDSTTRVLPE